MARATAARSDFDFGGHAVSRDQKVKQEEFEEAESDAGARRSVTGQRLQQRQTQRPFAVARFDVDVAGVLQAHKLAAPGPRIGARPGAPGNRGRCCWPPGCCGTAASGTARVRSRSARRGAPGRPAPPARRPGCAPPPRAAGAWWRCSPGCARRSPPARACSRMVWASDRHPGLARGRDPVVLLARARRRAAGRPTGFASGRGRSRASRER